MSDKTRPKDQNSDLTCPECRAELKRRRSRNVDACEMVCGGCGQIFDVCDIDTVAELKKQTP
jgi:ribosomal protein L37AE/L43A